MLASGNIVSKNFLFSAHEKTKRIPDDTSRTKLNFHSFIAHLKSKFGVISEFQLDQNNSPKCIYLQDSYMKDVFNFYPDRICLDVSHRILDGSIFLYLFLCEDPNGCIYTISVGLLFTDDADSLMWLLNTFKRHNPNWRRTKIILADPEIKARDIIRNSFPNPFVIICSYHAFRSFKNGIENGRIVDNLSSEQKKFTLDLFRSMYLAHTQAEYEVYYQQFLLLHSSLVSYFQEFWLPIQYQWRTGLDYYHEDIFYAFTSYLEYLDSNIKPVYMADSNIMDFLKKLFLILLLKRKEKSSVLTFSNPVLYSRFSPEYQISRVLTPFASKFVINQLDLSYEINVDCSILSESYFFDNFGSSVSASASVCSCQFFLLTFLPCRHIFAVRKMLSLFLFEEGLCDFSWNMKYYQNSISSVHDYFNQNDYSLPCDSGAKRTFVSDLLENTMSLILETSQSVFESHFQLLKQLVLLWKNDKDVYLEFVGIEKNTPNQNPSDLSTITSDKAKQSLESCKSESISSSSDHNVSLESHSIIPECGALSIELTLKQGKWNFKSRILSGKHINYVYLCRIICNTKESCIDWLREKNLIPATMVCPSCGSEMRSKNISRLTDGAVWTCPNIMIESSNSAQILDLWLNSCAGEDTFLKFLQAATTIYHKDSAKRFIL
ncbi:uncharacterized protein LOC118183859 isoform X2 [Stegodyphus dumicola]|uniref:uncharacterized protein LOC118183859 isoform X2 n=1 Tax=Stegodyphus dumicola TaxID=202533 RepID=UPI0015A8AC1B|nr:uncharacterized protein LOC118183859 isoform X2 [Stegodyphus dumicola]